ncbi:MAG: hypothetical protein QXN96_03130, partial [Candidatus Bathyarchaeia archaeon]
TYEEFLERIPLALGVLKEYAEKLISKNVAIEELLIAKRLSKRPYDYAHDVFQAVAARQLMMAGFDVYPGQTVQYLIVDADNKNPIKRVVAAQLLGLRQRYDAHKYLEMLFDAGETLLGVFGYDLDRLRNEVLYSERQLIL